MKRAVKNLLTQLALVALVIPAGLLAIAHERWIARRTIPAPRRQAGSASTPLLASLLLGAAGTLALVLGIALFLEVASPGALPQSEAGRSFWAAPSFEVAR